MDPRIAKVTVNIGVGESGEKLGKAETLLQGLLEQKPVRTKSRATHPEFGVKKREAIGVKVTLRGKKAHDFLVKAFEAVDNEVSPRKFDREGNLSFGIKEYIEIPGTKYDPKIGVFGMDVCVNLERPGYRIKRRCYKQRKVPEKERITKEESMKFFSEKYKIKMEEESGD
jgi:large subunit ribosomal protein L5